MVLPLIVFFAGASVMMLEIVGSRLMAPYVGSSLHTWTALISIVLGALSVGYLLGGIFADRFPKYSTLAVILAISGLFVSATKMLELLVFPLILAAGFDIRLQAIIGGMILFAPANVLLGMVSPVAMKLTLSSLKTSGHQAGRLYAVSTLGSIVGTVVSGFFLLPVLGHTTILSGIAGMLFICAGVVLLMHRQRSLVVIGCIILGVFLAWISYISGTAITTDIDTEYNRVWIVRGIDEQTKRPVIGIQTDPYVVQTLMFADADNEPVSAYIKLFHSLSSATLSHHSRALIIGGGAYAYPKQFLSAYPNGTIDVVELDPGITTIARNYFHLVDDPRLKIHHTDGRLFLTSTNSMYDVIFYDVFGQAMTPPFHLVTRESLQLVDKRLATGGMFLMNLLAAPEGESRMLFETMHRTITTVFPSVQVFFPQASSKTEVQNIIFVATRDTGSEAGRLAAGDIFTDEHAPVEYLARGLYN